MWEKFDEIWNYHIILLNLETLLVSMNNNHNLHNLSSRKVKNAD